MSGRDDSVEEVLRAIVDNEITEDRFPYTEGEAHHDWLRRASRLRDEIVLPLVSVVEEIIKNQPDPTIAPEILEGDLTAYYDSTTCDGPRCGATFVWAITEQVRPMPLDPLPVAEGNVEVLGRARLVDHIRRPLVRVRKKSDAPSLLDEPVLLYVSHFVTCPDADSFRRR